MKKINLFMKVFIGIILAFYAGCCLFICFNYWRTPELYDVQSAPWYTGIIVYGIFTVIIIAVVLLIWFIISRVKKGKR